MSNECAVVHTLSNELDRFRFPFDESKIPLNGIYILFQKDEKGHQQDRIVRIGTHTGDNQLRPRLKQHFLKENKDRSIFRKNIGRALLNLRNDPFLEFWDIDLTTKKSRSQYLYLIDMEYQNMIEQEVTCYIQDNFSFSVFNVQSKEKRLELESKLISTVSWCNECKPSDVWLGSSSPKIKIV